MAGQSFSRTSTIDVVCEILTDPTINDYASQVLEVLCIRYSKTVHYLGTPLCTGTPTMPVFARSHTGAGSNSLDQKDGPTTSAKVWVWRLGQDHEDEY